MITIVHNKKLENGDIETEFPCDFQFEYGCNGISSLHLAKIEEGELDDYKQEIICKSCLNYLISRIDREIVASF